MIPAGSTAPPPRDPDRAAPAGSAVPPGGGSRWSRVDRLAGGLAADLGLYALSAGFAAVTAATSTLLPHRAWGTVATAGYLLAALLVCGQLLLRRRRTDMPLAGAAARTAITALTFATTALLPLAVQAIQRAGGRTDRAQEEVLVVERAGARLLEHGTPYLGHDAIAALPPDERLLGYTPYQPGMALFGLPRALAGDGWWTDARVWFALVTAAVLGLAVAALRHPARPAATDAEWPAGSTTDRGTDPYPLVRALQLATVLPICALTLATGGDDLPVLALCLLALALGAARRLGLAGLVIGIAGALKLFAWPVALVLLIHAGTRGWRTAARVAAGALGLPVAALLPAWLVDPPALVENVLRFPLGHGLVASPAQSPFPGHLIASGLPGGRILAAALLGAAGLAIAVRLARRPPRTAAATATICGYGLLAAILLMPSTRFGYLLYPIAFLAWAPALRLRPAGRTDRAKTAAAAVPAPAADRGGTGDRGAPGEAGGPGGPGDRPGRNRDTGRVRGLDRAGGRVPADVLAVIAVGGALGSAARYGVGAAWPTPPGGFPWATLCINLTGCALIGALMRVVTARIAPHRLLRPFLGTGVLGGFTTFSTYAVETRGLVAGGRLGLAAGYVLGTLAGALAAVALGAALAGRIRPLVRPAKGQP